MSAISEIIPPLLHPTFCPNCGYSLAGLPEHHPCPECARTLDASEVVLSGWGRGKRETVGTAKRSRLLWAVLPSLIFVGVFTVFMLHSRAYFFAPFIALYFLGELMACFRRPGGGETPLVQVRLSKDGCAQYDDLCGPSVLRELQIKFTWVLALAGAIALLIGMRFRMVDWLFGGIYSVLLFITSFRGLRAFRRYRREIRHMNEEARADLNRVFIPLQPWRKVKSFDFTQLSPTAQRLQIVFSDQFVEEKAANIDAELICSFEQSEALAKLINQWRDATS